MSFNKILNIAFSLTLTAFVTIPSVTLGDESFLKGTYEMVLKHQCGSTNNYEPDEGEVDRFIFDGNQMVYESYGQCVYRYTYKILDVDSALNLKAALTEIKLVNGCTDEQKAEFEKEYREIEDKLKEERLIWKWKFEFQDGTNRVTISDAVISDMDQKEESAKDPNLNVSDCYAPLAQ